MLRNGWGAEGPRKTGRWKTFGGKYMQWYNTQAKDMATYRPNWPRGQKNVLKKVLYCTIQYCDYYTAQKCMGTKYTYSLKYITALEQLQSFDEIGLQ